MTKASRSTFAVATSLLLSLSLPQSTRAQELVAYGTWNGYATDTETGYDQYGNVIGRYSQSGSSQLDVYIYSTTDPYAPFYATVTGPPRFETYYGSSLTPPLLYGVSLGPTSASGSGYEGGGFRRSGRLRCGLPVDPPGWPDRYYGRFRGCGRFGYRIFWSGPRIQPVFRVVQSHEPTRAVGHRPDGDRSRCGRDFGCHSPASRWQAPCPGKSGGWAGIGPVA